MEDTMDDKIERRAKWEERQKGKKSKRRTKRLEPYKRKDKMKIFEAEEAIEDDFDAKYGDMKYDFDEPEW